MHKLIVYRNGVTNPTITKLHGMTYTSRGKNETKKPLFGNSVNIGTDQSLAVLVFGPLNCAISKWI